MDYLLQRIVSELVLPPFGPFLLLMLGFFLFAARRRRLGMLCAALASIVMFGLSLAGLNNRVRSWPEVPARVEAPHADADAIVVLGAGRYLAAPEYNGDTAAAGTLERVRYAARLYRETGKPVLVSGGKPGGLGTRSEAEIMREILEDEFDVPVRWVEPDSEDTRQNAEFSAALLHAAGIDRVYLVTHGFHAGRAADEFRRYGIEPVPMVTGFVRPIPESLLSWMPSFDGLARNRAWVYEQLARLNPF